MAPTNTANRAKYTRQRPKVSIPVVPTSVLRKAKGLTLQDVCNHLRDEHGMAVDRGTISAIENGHRGGSVKMLAAYADALGIAVTAIDTQYEPRQRSVKAVS
ncbi:helix-turn-helix domain-containing protein [Mycobacterium marinum]|uniref:helix-turn-helix domain-containing protein n=1 Tax=Mycobacterium marinum TaxID=1781 RepID=UPI000B9734D5|nr:helix-turn-helix transcriptional regulator [Mycobacterium marinum]